MAMRRGCTHCDGNDLSHNEVEPVRAGYMGALVGGDNHGAGGVEIAAVHHKCNGPS